MKDFLKLAKERKSTYEFSEKKVSPQNLNKILEAGRWAPSALNIQPWHFIIVKNKKTIRELIGASHYGEFHHSPDMIIAVVLKEESYKKLEKKLGQNASKNHLQMCIAMTCLQMCLEAKDLKIDSCLLSPEQKSVKRILRLKRDDVPLIIGLGYEKKGAYQRERERKKLSSIVSYD